MELIALLWVIFAAKAMSAHTAVQTSPQIVPQCGPGSHPGHAFARLSSYRYLLHDKTPTCRQTDVTDHFTKPRKPEYAR
ncbi:MAG: hypothetical protein RO009_11050 [Pseudorhodoplanes sp.]|jgi:hypothetical protein|nr:hypothetical protein [Pseudorhodoplanes sp.]